MFHCPNCHRLIKNGVEYCPYCRYHIHYVNPNVQMNPQSDPPKQHRYFQWVIIVILLAIIGFGGYHILNISSGQQTTQQTSSESNQANENSRSTKTPATKTHHLVSGNTTSKLQNKPGYTLSVFPNNIQGTWYSYDDDKLDTLVITPTSASFNGHPEVIHARSKKAVIPNKITKETKDWATAIPCVIRGQHFSEIRGWAQSAGDGVSYAEFNANGVSVLDEAGGAGFSTDANFFKTKALAKQYKKKLFKSHGEHSDL